MVAISCGTFLRWAMAKENRTLARRQAAWIQAPPNSKRVPAGWKRLIICDREMRFKKGRAGRVFATADGVKFSTYAGRCDVVASTSVAVWFPTLQVPPVGLWPLE